MKTEYGLDLPITENVKTLTDYMKSSLIDIRLWLNLSGQFLLRQPFKQIELAFITKKLIKLSNSYIPEDKITKFVNWESGLALKWAIVFVLFFFSAIGEIITVCIGLPTQAELSMTITTIFLKWCALAIFVFSMCQLRRDLITELISSNMHLWLNGSHLAALDKNNIDDVFMEYYEAMINHNTEKAQQILTSIENKA